MVARILSTLAFAVLITQIAFAQNVKNKQEKDQKAIKSQCGCYEVGFNFIETFNYSEDSTYQPSKEKHAGGLEWVQLVEDKDDKIVMQHLLIVGDPSEPHIVKHWRQDWLYENRDFYMFDHENQWKYVKKSKGDVAGQWTQKVYQVDDSPRYEGSATWVHVDGKSYWENTTDAPLPRREYTKRSDYNVTVRRNRHEITKEGWIHDQYNDKVVREAGKEDVVLAEEKGLNTYVKVEDAKCKAAQDWWAANEVLWQKVRTKWEAVFAQKQDLVLNHKVEDKRLYEHLFSLEASANEAEVKKIIDGFVKK